MPLTIVSLFHRSLVKLDLQIECESKLLDIDSELNRRGFNRQPSIATDFPNRDVKFTQDLGKLNRGVIQYYHA
jgi:hypothetical protein